MFAINPDLSSSSPLFFHLFYEFKTTMRIKALLYASIYVNIEIELIKFGKELTFLIN
jgi:hypothetical protein